MAFTTMRDGLLASLGESVTYTRAAGGSFSAVALVSKGDEFEERRNSIRARFEMKVEDFSGTGPVEGDSIAYDGMTLEVANVVAPASHVGVYKIETRLRSW